MKKFVKLQINSEKLIKNEDLLRLRGGYEDCFYCVCGFCPDFYGACNPVWASDLETALHEYEPYCGGRGVSCNGNGCPQWYC